MPYVSLFGKNEETLSLTSHIFLTKITGQQKIYFMRVKREKYCSERERERESKRELDQIYRVQDRQYR